MRAYLLRPAIKHLQYGGNLLIGRSEEHLHPIRLLRLPLIHRHVAVILPSLGHIVLSLHDGRFRLLRRKAAHIGLVGGINDVDGVEIGNVLELLQLHHLPWYMAFMPAISWDIAWVAPTSKANSASRGTTQPRINFCLIEIPSMVFSPYPDKWRAGTPSIKSGFAHRVELP